MIWLRLTQQVVFKDEQPGIRQLMLIDNDSKVLSISKPSNPAGTDMVRTTANVCVREIPGEYKTPQTIIFHFRILGGEMIYSFEYPVRSITGVPFRPAVITSDDQHVIVAAADKSNRDCVMVFSAQNGALIHRIPLKNSAIKVRNKVITVLAISRIFLLLNSSIT